MSLLLLSQTSFRTVEAVEDEDRPFLVKGQKRHVKNEPDRKHLPARVINDTVKQHKEESPSITFLFLKKKRKTAIKISVLFLDTFSHIQYMLKKIS